MKRAKKFKSRIVVSNMSNNGESLCWGKDFFTCSNLSLADIVKSKNSRVYSNVNLVKAKTMVVHSNNKVLKSVHKTCQPDQYDLNVGVVK